MGGHNSDNFFNKMSYHGARVKIRSGIVRLLIPCVCSEIHYATLLHKFYEVKRRTD